MPTRRKCPLICLFLQGRLRVHSDLLSDREHVQKKVAVHIVDLLSCQYQGSSFSSLLTRHNYHARAALAMLDSFIHCALRRHQRSSVHSLASGVQWPDQRSLLIPSRLQSMMDRQVEARGLEKCRSPSERKWKHQNMLVPLAQDKRIVIFLTQILSSWNWRIHLAKSRTSLIIAGYSACPWKTIR